MNDNELVAEARKGNQGAFKLLVERHEGRVAAMVIGMLGKGDDAEDVGQETFIRFYNALDKFRGESSVGTYLTRIAINLCLNEIKKRKRSSLTAQETELENFADPVNQNDPEEREKNEMVRKAILKLKPDYRTVVILRLMEGYSTQETSDILKLPLGTVLSRLSRAQQRLRDILKPSIGVAYAG